MAKLILKFEGREIREYSLDAHAVTVGRLPDNVVVIDNAAVSSHHARVSRDGESYVLEDLESTNGTFMGNRMIGRHRLQDGDEAVVGKHTLVFVDKETEDPASLLPDMGGTVFLDTKAHRELLAKMTPEIPGNPTTPPKAPMPPPKAPVAAPPERAVLRVLSGGLAGATYTLRRPTSVIGRSRDALIRLRGWFKPKVAVVVSRTGKDYIAIPLAGRPRVNSQPMQVRHVLHDGDVLQISGLAVEFTLGGRSGRH